MNMVMENPIYTSSQEDKGILKGGVPIVVSSVKAVSHQLDLSHEGQYGIAVYRLDGQKLERGTDFNAYNFIPGKRLQSIQITLSDGTRISVFQLNLPFHLPNGERISNKVRINVGNRTTLTWLEASQLCSGDEFIREYPFQWVGGYLTDGVVSLPRERPAGQADWKKCQIQAVPAEYWNLFLSGLEGKFRSELIEYRQALTAKRQNEAKPRLTERQLQTEAVIRGQMWQGPEGSRVSFGRNVMFELASAGKYKYVIDNPGKGAIYLFEHRDQAVALANGEIPRAEARYKHERIIHDQGWEDKLTNMLRL